MKTLLVFGTAILAAGSLVPTASAQVRVAPRRAPMGRAEIVTNGGPYLGIGVKDVDADRAKALSMKDVRGSEITSVSPESPAAKAGLKEGDVVLEFNGQAVEGQQQLSRMVRETPVGHTVKLGVWRNGSMQTVTATIEANKNTMVYSGGDGWMQDMHIPDMGNFQFNMPEIEIPQFQMMTGSPMIGIMGESLGQQEQLAEFFGVKEGVLVKSVNKGSAAEKAGIKAGDVIVKIDDNRVGSTSEITSALRGIKSKNAITVVLVRNKKEMPVTVTIESTTPGRAVRAGMLVPPGVLVASPKMVVYRRGGTVVEPMRVQTLPARVIRIRDRVI